MAGLFLAPILYRCYYCQFESTENAFKYFDNKKVEQPRHQCRNCHKLFTLGSHGRPQGRTYAKKRNEDPDELKNLSRECRHCGVADNSRFKYYNNKNRLQPRFKCLSCGNQFQMRLMGTGGEMRLVHTSCNQTQATGRRKKGTVPLPCDPLMPLEPGTRLFPENCGEDQEYASFLEAELTDEDEIGGFLPELSGHRKKGTVPLPCDPLMPLEPGTRLFPENCGEDQEYASFLEAELTDEDEIGRFLPELSAEDAELLALLEIESSTKENEEAVPDPTICTLNEDYARLPLDVTVADNAEFIAFLEATLL